MIRKIPRATALAQIKYLRQRLAALDVVLRDNLTNLEELREDIVMDARRIEADAQELRRSVGQIYRPVTPSSWHDVPTAFSQYSKTDLGCGFTVLRKADGGIREVYDVITSGGVPPTVLAELAEFADWGA